MNGFPFYEQAPKENVEHCNLCGSVARTQMNKVDRYGLTAPVVECVDCGLQFLSCRMTPEAYRRFYEGGHYRRLLEGFYGRPFTPESLEAEQATYAGRLSAWLFGHINGLRGGAMLDIGGSTGVVAERLAKDYQFVATVLEPHGAESRRARDRGLVVATATMEEFDPLVKYDLITLCQTVDHLLDIRGALAKIWLWLQRDGLFFVDFVEDGPIKIDHPYYLTRKTMLRYLEEAGFRTVYMEPSGDGLHVNVLAVIR